MSSTVSNVNTNVNNNGEDVSYTDGSFINAYDVGMNRTDDVDVGTNNQISIDNDDHIIIKETNNKNNNKNDAGVITTISIVGFISIIVICSLFFVAKKRKEKRSKDSQNSLFQKFFGKKVQPYTLPVISNEDKNPTETCQEYLNSLSRVNYKNISESKDENSEKPPIPFKKSEDESAMTLSNNNLEDVKIYDAQPIWVDPQFEGPFSPRISKDSLQYFINKDNELANLKKDDLPFSDPPSITYVNNDLEPNPNTYSNSNSNSNSDPNSNPNCNDLKINTNVNKNNETVYLNTTPTPTIVINGKHKKFESGGTFGFLAKRQSLVNGDTNHLNLLKRSSTDLTTSDQLSANVSQSEICSIVHPIHNDSLSEEGESIESASIIEDSTLLHKSKSENFNKVQEHHRKTYSCVDIPDK